ncbi:uncharacterized protein plekhg6 [Syngnathoides biaculeatus]|uniref:uncharacterized protein plekhg6 n=1 Tax=Syngnathoides biaculeatus TaxID=300417 RepID=UPI002ADDEC66|nr:uncharacterized protein plekhg6 [Syngnathoides biaculeatus]XP_061675694.1 uncharacterized protein plekhg6 [Syngnathoides biaculeatus]
METLSSAMDPTSVQSRYAGDGGLMEPDVHAENPAHMSFYHKVFPDKVKFYTYGHKTRQKVVSNYSTMTKGLSTTAKPRAALKQVFLNQGVSDRNPTAEEKIQLDVLKQELETFAVPVTLKWRWREESRGCILERNWTDIVKYHSLMSRVQRHQQEAMWEFVLTELNYINRLIIIKDLVIAALVNLHLRGFLQEVTPERLFSNLPAILSAHQLFWQEVIYPMLQEVRSTGKPFNPLRLERGCLQFRERFLPYCHYCAEGEKSFEFARQQMESNPHFFTYVQWVETHPQCARMRIGDMQAKPHQRITKYSLLLKAVLKTTQDPSVQRSLRNMMSSVHNFLESINDYLRLKDEEVALSISAQRLEGYVMEGINEEIDKHVREICQFDLTCPIRGAGRGVVRKLILEENLKIRGRKDTKLDVVALLFSDVLLMTKVQKKVERLKVVRPPLPLDRTYCVALKDSCSFLLVEVGELWCPVNVYIFTASTSERCSAWVSAIHQAKVTLRNLRDAESRQSEGKERSSVVARPHDPEIKQPALISEKGAFVEKTTHKRIVTQFVNGVHAFKGNPQNYREDNGWWEGGEESGNHFSTNSWNHVDIPATNMNNDYMSAYVRDPLRRVTTRLNTVVPGGYPDVDYPTDELNTSHSQIPGQTQPYKKEAELAREARILTSQPINRSTGKKLNPTELEGSPSNPETKGFISAFKSPVLQRRRMDTSNQGSSAQTVHSSQLSASNNSSSDSDCSVNVKSSKSHIVLKLSALKPIQGTSWNNSSKASPDAEIFSEPELMGFNSHNKKHRLTRRTISISSAATQEDQRFFYPDRYSDMSPSPASLENLLQRSKGRARDWETPKSNKNEQLSNLNPKYCPPPSPLTSSSPSQSQSDGDRDAEWEDEVQLHKHRALRVSRGWREQPVDEDGDNKLDSPLFTNGENVDWPGWCFDDDEVMDYLHPGAGGLLEDINQSLTHCAISEEEDDLCSRV